jgi:dihydropteroate synthase
MNEIRLLSLKSIEDIKEEIFRIGADEQCIDTLSSKGKFFIFKISNLRPASCNIIKQTALSSGTDAAVHRDVVTGKIERSNMLLFGTKKEITRVAEKLKGQPFGLDIVSKNLIEGINRQKANRYLKTAKRELNIANKVLIMGALNVTPDSFSDGGKFLTQKNAVKRALEMEKEGADIIDIGGESSRPGSEPVTVDEELKRVIPVLNELNGRLKIPISIDTYKSKVAEKAMDSGAEIVNDISSLRFDERMMDIVSQRKPGLIIMHMKGKPKTMQDNPSYKDTIQEIYDFLKERTDYALSNGLERERIIIDPGIGFGKRQEDNLEILYRAAEFTSLGYLLLIGASRKSFIGRALNVPVEERLEGSLAACGIAMEEGVNIIRVHDVKSTRKFVDMYMAIKQRDNGAPG